MATKISADEKKRLKGLGFIPQKDGEHFACRIITEDGCLNTAESTKVTEIAEEYGRGYVSYTVRLTVEIPWLKYEDVEKVQAELAEVGLVVGGTGPRVRPIVACKGTVCVFGRLDTQEFARELHEIFYEGHRDVILPHKFKIGIGGCPNNCIKPDLNDIGITGQRMIGNKEDGSDAQKEGLKIFIGGRWGKKVRRGDPLEGLYSKDETIEIIKKAIFYYKENGNPKERFGEMIERIGIEEVSRNLIEK